MFTLGLDIAPTHSAAVLVHFNTAVDDPVPTAEPVDHWFITGQARVAKKAQGRGVYLQPLKKGLDPEVLRMRRLEALRDMLRRIRRHLADHGVSVPLVGVEGYHFGQRRPKRKGKDGKLEDAAPSMSHAHDMGGSGDLVRFILYNTGIPFRAYAVGQIRKLCCHHGNLAKPKAHGRILDRWPAVGQFDRYRFDTYPTTTEDLIDAFAAGVTAGVEAMLRGGNLRMEQLQIDAEREVFLTVSSLHKTNLLGIPPVAR